MANNQQEFMDDLVAKMKVALQPSFDESEQRVRKEIRKGDRRLVRQMDQRFAELKEQLGARPSKPESSKEELKGQMPLPPSEAKVSGYER